MRHHMYNPGFNFVKAPMEFNKSTERDTLQYCLGATLYMPGTKDIREKVINHELPVTSFVMCCEDAIKEEDLPAAEQNIHVHTWLNKMTKDECREDTRRAVDSLEQCIGEKVRSYRAPAFSIGVNNKWALETLVENGIDRDASIFPASRSFGGFAHFGQKMPCRVEYNGIQIKEFPICTTTILGKELAYSGGGYFRFFPLHFIKKVMTRSPYVMCYFHIGDLVPESRGIQSKEEYESYFKEKGTVQARYMRYIKANVGKKHALEKMLSLIKEYDYLSLDKADAVIEWDVTPIVRL